MIPAPEVPNFQSTPEAQLGDPRHPPPQRTAAQEACRGRSSEAESKPSRPVVLVDPTLGAEEDAAGETAQQQEEPKARVRHWGGGVASPACESDHSPKLNHMAVDLGFAIRPIWSSSGFLLTPPPWVEGEAQAATLEKKQQQPASHPPTPGGLASD